MIRIRLESGKSFNTLEKSHIHGILGDNNPYKINEELKKLISSQDGWEEIYTYLIDNLEDIIVGCPCTLQQKVSTIELKIGDISKLNKNGKRIFKKRFFSNIKKVFNYDKFCKTKVGWGAYALTEYLQSSVCPYCNRNYTSFLLNKTRPQLDHFFPKSEYPYLSLSLYNLIPSCAICNSRGGKGNKIFSLTSNIHPYIEDFENDVLFTLFPKQGKSREYLISNYCSDESDFEIDFADGPNLKPGRKLAILDNIETFTLKGFYNLYKIEALEILNKNAAYKSGIKNPFTEKLRLTKFEDKYRYVYGCYWEREKFSLRPLSKFTRDIYLYCEPEEINKEELN